MKVRTLFVLTSSGQCAIFFYFSWPDWQMRKPCLHFAGMAVCTLEVNVAKCALKPHPPSFHLTKRNSAKELSQKSMPSAWPFQPGSPTCFSCSKHVDFSPMFNCVDFSNMCITGQKKACCKERNLSFHHQILQVTAQEVSL